MRISMKARTRIAAVAVALSVLAVTGVVHAQFTPPTCVPPNCSPEVIQNIAITSAAQSASINVTGSAKLGGTFQAGALAPVLTAATDNLYYGNVGGTSTNGSLLLLQFGSADRLRVGLTGQMQLPLGSAAAPSYTFLGDTNTGLFSQAADSMSFASNGVVRTVINNNGTTVSSGVLTLPVGAVGAPSMTYAGDTNTGLYRSAADTINIVTNGISRFQIDSTGLVTVPGAMTVNGVLTASGGYAGDGSGLTNLNASNIASGTLNDARLSSNVALLNGTQTFTGANTFSNAANSFTGNGSGLTNLNASNITSGTIAVAYLPATVVRTNTNQTITGAKTFTADNTFSGMNSFGSEALVAGAGQNVLYGVADSTSAGNLLLLQSEAGGVYTDRFRVAANGDVTVNGNMSITGSLTGGSVPWARLSGFPAACPAGQYASAVGGALTCSTPPGVISSVSGSGAGISVSPTTGAVVVSNTGVTSLIAGTGINVSGATGAVTVSNTGLTGSGSTNYVPKFTGATTLANSSIQDNGTSIGLGGAPSAWSVEAYGNIHGKGFNGTVVDQTAVYGQTTDNVAFAQAGVYGLANGTQYGYGVYGIYNGTNANGYGVFGRADAAGHTAIYGYSSSGRAGYFFTNGGPAAIRAQANASPFLAIDADGDIYGSRHLTIDGNATLGNAAGDVHVVNGNLSFGANSRFTLPSISSDPGSPVNGMMYYNTAGLFRCYEAGVWKNCIANTVPTLDAVLQAGNTTTRTMTTGAHTINAVGAIGLTVNGAFGQNAISTTGGYAGIDSSGTAYGGKFTSAGAYGIHVSNTGTGAGLRYGIYTDTSTGLNVEGIKVVGNNSNLALDVTGGDAYFANNLGIGTTTPYERLHVAGRALFDGEIAIGPNGPWTNYGVVSQASESAGHFFNSLYPSVYGSFGYASSGNRYGVYGSAIDGTGTTNYAGYFYASGGGTNYGIRTYGSTYGIYASGGSYAVYAAGTLATSGNLVAESNTNGSGDGWHYCELDSATAGWQYCTCANGSFVGNLAVYNPGSYGVARDIATYCYKP